MLEEQAISQVIAVDLVGELTRTVGETCSRGGLDDSTTLACLDTRVLQRIQVDGQAARMLREFLRSSYRSEAETRRIVRSHRALVIGAEVINQPHAGYRIFSLEQPLEDVNQVIGNSGVTDHFALAHMSVEIVVQQAQIAQVIAPKTIASGFSHRQRDALHPSHHRVWDRHLEESVVLRVNQRALTDKERGQDD